MTVLTVADPATTPADTIVGAFFPSTSGIAVDAGSIAIVSGTSSIGFYDGSLATLGIGAGLLITSGTMPGFSNTVGWFGQDNGMVGDPALDAVVNTVFSTVSYDATTISFNFTVTDPAITGISFKVVFGTDEYPEWVDQFVDIAVVLVNGVNVAYFNNDPFSPLSVVTPNLAAGYFIDNADSHLPIEYDGVSAVLNVTAPVHLGLNTFTIGIADTGDHIYDSGLFISGLTATNVPVGGVTLDVPCTEGDDTKDGGGASETFNALAGDDHINAQGGDDVVLGGAGDDTLSGGDGKDFLDGGPGHDHIAGDAGDDQIQFSGDDAIDGGDGVDTLLMDASLVGGAVTLDISDPTVQQTLGDGSTIQGVEILKFTGGAEVDVVTGGALADLISTGAGDDVIAGGEGGDSLDGGDGTDTAAFAGLSTDYLVTGDGAGGYTVQNLATGNVDALANIEQLQFADGAFAIDSLVITGATIVGTSGDDDINASQAPAGQPFTTALGDTITSGAGDDVIASGAGNDVIDPGDDNDKVDAGAGDDTILGSLGSDEINGGDGTDTVVYTGAYSDYSVAPGGDGWLVTDLRAGAPDGADQLSHVEHIQFADTTMTVGEGAPPAVDGGDVSGGLTEPGAPNGVQTLSGAFSFGDPDHDDTHSIEVIDQTGNQAGVTFTAEMTQEPNDGTGGQVQWGLDVDTAVIDALGEGQVRTLTYTVRIHDSGGNHVDQLVSFALTGTNDAPAISGPVTAGADAGAASVSVDALANATDADAGAKLIVVDLPVGLPDGVSFDNQTHAFVLDPTNAAFAAIPAGEVMTFGFDYGVTDGFATTTAHAEFSVTGTAVANQAPTAQADAKTLAEDGSVSGQAGATDPESQALTFTLVSDAQHGSLTFNADGTYSYAPAADYNGADSFSFKANDGSLDSNTATVDLTVTPVNDAPTLAHALTDTTGQEGTAFNYTVAGNTFADVDGDALALTAALADGSALPSWMVFDAATGAFSGTPASGGSYDIRVTAADPSLAAVSDVFHLDVAGGQTLTGTAGADTLIGGAYADHIYGLGGGDTLRGMGGNDWLEGGLGNDLIDGGAGVDTASYANAASGVTLSLAVTKAQNTGGAGRDTLVGIENLTGSAFADTLTGDGGANRLDGGAGADVLRGGAGADDLYGGGGADRFVFGATSESASPNGDTIWDFSHADGDRIDLSLIDAIAGSKKDQAFTLVNAFGNHAGELVSIFDTDHWMVQGDVNGDGVADFQINVVGVAATPLGATDFIF